jgi:pseudomonalisin/xanthomonalisin
MKLVQNASRKQLFQRPLLMTAISLCLAQAAQADTGWVQTQTHAFNFKPSIPRLAALPGTKMHIVVGLKLRNKAQLDQQAAAIRKGTAPFKRLSAQTFTQQFAPTQAQVQAVVDHLTRSGFTNIKVATNRLLISADGTAATVKTAFNTSIQQFTDGKRQVFANTSAAQVPKALSGTVLSVLGLQNDKIAHTMSRRAAQIRRHVRPEDQQVGHYPMEFASLYNAGASQTGSLSTVGIIAQGDLTQTLADLQQFQTSNSLSVPVSTVYTAPNSGDTSGMAEWDMDSQSSIGAAGGSLAQLIFYIAPTLDNSALTVAYNQAVTDNKAVAINVSLGECEADSSQDGTNATQDQIFEAAMVQGQTFSVSSGDSGSDECGDGGTNQSYPAVSPYVVAVSGTTLTTDDNNKYLSESVWNGTGGGPASTENAPAWQVRSGVLNSSPQRGVADVAFDADPNTGALVIVGGEQQQWGGTSLSAPIFAGIWARLQSGVNNMAGFGGNWLYMMGVNNASAFHDITDGSNGAYNAGPGWDYPTGWGSIDISAFNSAMNLGAKNGR